MSSARAAARPVSEMTLDDEIPPVIDDVVRRVPELSAGPVHASALPGGLTNHNFKVVTASGRQAVIRLSSPQGELLAIDRDVEYANSLAAAAAGVAPGVLGYLPDLGALVIDWIEGRTLAAADLDDAATVARVADTCRRLHAGPRFAADFDMVALQRRYLDLVVSEGYRLPPTYLDLMPQITAIGEALRARTLPTVPCHNDLLPANLMDDGEQIWFVDFEYSGNGDPCFELGNMWSETEFPADRLDGIVEAYFGRASRAMVARARLFGLLANYGWTLWASIQTATSAVDFDFWTWGMGKFDRAAAELGGPDMTRLIRDVQQ
ncbi:MAG TPA: phosphotransferase [Mycobacteriales bacterium]|nr:phosphotransferase [Mycobacteriales bacterium]